jgi:nitrogen fixation NifU-like protein
MLNLYQEIVMDHYKNPRNRGVLTDCHFITQQRNSACGDEIICSSIITDNKISAINFDGKGCVISQASASLLSEKVKNTIIQDIFSFNEDMLTSLIGIPLGPVRMQCALLSLQALQKGLQEYMEK